MQNKVYFPNSLDNLFLGRPNRRRQSRESAELEEGRSQTFSSCLVLLWGYPWPCCSVVVSAAPDRQRGQSRCVWACIQQGTLLRGSCFYLASPLPYFNSVISSLDPSSHGGGSLRLLISELHHHSLFGSSNTFQTRSLY